MPASKNPKKRPRKGTFWNRASLKAAVYEWIANEQSARAKHGDIAEWDVANVTDMHCMFEEAEVFNGDLSQWDVANVTDMRRLFALTKTFNGDLSQWDVANVINMQGMFDWARAFDGNLARWDLGRVVEGKPEIEQRIVTTYETRTLSE